MRRSPEYRKRHLPLPLPFVCVDLWDGTLLMQSHICRDLSRARHTHARGLRACVWKTERLDTDVRPEYRSLGSCPCAYKWGMERHIGQTSTKAGDTSYRCAALIQNQQPCLTLRSSCASWHLSHSPPPVTSRTAREEGNERCRRLGSDRFGPSSFLPSLRKSSL